MEGVQGRQGTLSRRELEVAALVAEGLTNRAIAERMFISERTVDGHLEHIREKLGVSNRAQVATWFVGQSQAPAVTSPAVAIQPQRPRRLNRWLAVSAVVVVALVGSAVVYERITPTSPAGLAITVFTSKNPGDQLHTPWSLAVGSDGSVYIAARDDLAIRKVDPKAGSIGTYAGGVPLTNDPFVDGNDRLKAQIGFVTGVAIASDGSLYFASEFLVGRVAPDGTADFVAGSRTPPEGPGNPTGLINPVGLAFAPDGKTLYIADLGGNQIWKRTSDGALSVFAGTGHEGFGGDEGPATAAELDRPRAVAVEPDGDLLIADTGNDRIREVVHGSNVIETVAGSGDYYGFSGDGGPATKAKLSLPWGVAVGPSGTIYIADAGNDRVRVVSSKGIITSVVGAGLDAPSGMAFSATGDLYVVGLGDRWLRLVHLRGPVNST